MSVGSRVPSIANVIPENWNSVLRFSRDVQKYMSTLANSDQTLYISELYIVGSTASRLLATDASQKVISTNLTSWVTGTTNRVSVTNDGAGGVVLSGPQDIHTGASPTFVDLTLSAPSSIYALSHDSFTDFVLDEHVAHSSISVLAGTNLTGGGTIDGNVTLNVDPASASNWDDAYTHSQLTSGNPHSVTPAELSLVIGTDVQAWDADLDTLSGLAKTDGNFIVGNGTNWIVESGNTARTSLGLGTGDSPTFADLVVTNRLFFSDSNTAVGISTLSSLTTGTSNSAVGAGALGTLTEGEHNNAQGYRAGQYLTTGSYNSYIAREAGRYNQTGGSNVYVGAFAGQGASGNSQSYNTGLGSNAFRRITTGTFNLGVGFDAGFNITTGERNLFIGAYAGFNQTTNSNLLIIDNQNRDSAANELTSALLYGIFNATPANQSLRINGEILGSDGAKIGDGGTTNYAEFKSNGELNFHGEARYETHLDLSVARFQIPATNYPSVGFEGVFQTLDFDKNTEESVYAEDHVPYAWDGTTDVEVSVDWFHDSADNGVVVWGIEYISIKAGEIVDGTATTITQTSAGNHTAGELVTTLFTTKLLATNLESDDILAVRVFRKAADGNDTLAEDARLVQLHFHFTSHRLGEPL